MIIMSHLRRTYWSADHQYKLFHEALKAMDANHQSGPIDTGDLRAQPEASVSRIPPPNGDHQASVHLPPIDSTGFTSGGLDDFFVSFNPFVNFTPDFESATPADWAIGTNTLYGMQGT